MTWCRKCCSFAFQDLAIYEEGQTRLEPFIIERKFMLKRLSALRDEMKEDSNLESIDTIRGLQIHIHRLEMQWLSYILEPKYPDDRW